MCVSREEEEGGEVRSVSAFSQSGVAMRYGAASSHSPLALNVTSYTSGLGPKDPVHSGCKGTAMVVEEDFL